MSTKEELAILQGQTGMARPDFIEAGAAGTEHITQADMQMPRLVIAQKMSPEVDSTDSKYIDGLKQGDMFNGLTKEIYGRGPLHFVVLRADPPRGVEFIPREEGGGVRDPNVPLDDPRMQFGDKGEKPIATKFYDFIVMLMPLGDDPLSRMVALSFKSTGLKTARQLNGLIKLRNAAVYAGLYKLISKDTQNVHGKFAIPEVANAGWVTDKALFETLKMASESLKNKDIAIQREQDDHLPDDIEGDTSFNHGANVGKM